MRHEVAAFYRALHVHVTFDVQGMYAQLTSYGEHKPADVLVPSSATGSDKATALDITVTDPTNKTVSDRGSDRKPLVAAAIWHTVKLGKRRRALEEAGDQGLPSTKGPLVVETIGPLGRRHRKGRSQLSNGGGPTHTRSTPEQAGAKSWCISISIPGADGSKELEHRWSANKFSLYCVLATKFFNVTCQDASRIRSSVDTNCQKA